MKLIELLPRFLKIIDETSFQYQDSIEKSDGIIFLCPKCFTTNKGEIGTHSIICWFLNVPQTIKPAPGRWKPIGKDFNNLTLKAGSSSIKLDGGCKWHGFITAGEIINCKD